MFKCRKKRFSKEQADKIRIKCYYQSHILNNKNRKEQRCYFCEQCNAWHLTSKPELVKEEKNK